MSQAGTFINGGHPGGPILSLTGNSGGPVGPDIAGNIDIIGGTGAVVIGTPVSNTLTINVVGGGIKWNVIGSSQTLVANNGYIVTNTGSQSSLLLPTGTSTIGDTILVLAAGLGLGANIVNGGSWIITQSGAIQQTQFATFYTTPGAAGAVYSQLQNDFIELVYIGSNIWVGLDTVGNLSFT